MSDTKLTAEESCRQVLKSIADACDQESLARAGGYLFRYVQEDVRLREVLDALEGRAVIFDGLGARVGYLLDEMDEWIGRAGEAERLAEERLAHAHQLQADIEAEQQGRLALKTAVVGWLMLAPACALVLAGVAAAVQYAAERRIIWPVGAAIGVLWATLAALTFIKRQT